MKKHIFSIHDATVETFNIPFFTHNDAEAERHFRTLVNDPRSSANQHPADFCLFKLGTIDMETGEIEKLPAPKNMMSATSIKNHTATLVP